jgi:hypothetical protein
MKDDGIAWCMLAASTRLGPYEILAPLGAGEMGEVYRARESIVRAGNRNPIRGNYVSAIGESPISSGRFSRGGSDPGFHSWLRWIVLPMRGLAMILGRLSAALSSLARLRVPCPL